MIIINRLVLRGPSVSDASIDFKKGVNVIVGPSNTGKSYIFKCINFMLGNSEALPQINESIGYESVLLEIQMKEKIYTLERSVNGVTYKIFELPIENITKESSYIKLDVKYNPKKDNISDYLLQGMGYSVPVKLKKNASNDVNTLTLNYLRRFILLSEEQIISESSVLTPGDTIQYTLYNSLLKFLITGQDDSNLQSTFKSNSKKSIELQIKILEELKEESEGKLVFYNLSRPDISELKKIKEIEQMIQNKQDRINSLNRQCKIKMDNISEYDENLKELRVTSSKFEILEKQYRSDYERLASIDEGYQYFNQIPSVKCEACGSNISTSLVNNVDFQSALEKEQVKIQVHLTHLEQVKEDLINEIETKQAVLAETQLEYESLRMELDSTLIPDTLKLEEYISDLKRSIEYSALTEELKKNLKAFDEKIKLLIKLKLEIGNKGKTPVIKNKDVSEILNTSNFKAIFASTLKEWGIEPSVLKENLEFYMEKAGNNKYLDYRINGKARSSYGKGYRALIHSAFLVSLQEYFCEESLPSPGFIVLDSPVTTYTPNTKKSQDISNDLYEIFFTKLLTQHTSIQIIILDNKPVPVELMSKYTVNQIEFTGEDIGRKGFL